MQAQQVDTTQIYELQQVDVSAEKLPSVVRSLTPVQIVEGEEIARLGYQSPCHGYFTECTAERGKCSL